MNDLKKYIGKTWIWIVFLIAFLGFLDIASDVIAGFMISIIYLILITRYIKKYNLIRF